MFSVKLKDVGKIKDLPRGIRNNNPTNIKKSRIGWNGKIKSSDSVFEQFKDAKWGLRAGSRNAVTAITKHKCDSIEKIIYRWAPPSENKTQKYIDATAKRLGLDRTAKIPLTVKAIAELTRAIVRHENGVQPYSDEQLLWAAKEGLGEIAVKDATWEKVDTSTLSRKTKEEPLDLIDALEEYYVLNKHKAKKTRYRKRNKSIDGVILHATIQAWDVLGEDTNAESVYKWNNEQDGRMASFDFACDSDSIVKGVDIDKMTFHCRGYYKKYVGLEFCGNLEWDKYKKRDINRYYKTIFNGARICGYVFHKIGKTPTKERMPYHSELDPKRKRDPGDEFPRFQHLMATRMVYYARKGWVKKFRKNLEDQRVSPYLRKLILNWYLKTYGVNDPKAKRMVIK